MIPVYCPRCGKPLLAESRQCPFCGLDSFVPGPPGPPPTAHDRQSGWGVPQPDQSRDKTVAILGCLVIAVLLIVIMPLLATVLLLPSLVEQLRDLSSFPPGFPDEFPFPSFPPFPP
jgi:hypothetical protein